MDGEEDSGKGVDLWEFAEIAVSYGLVHFVVSQFGLFCYVITM